MGHADTKASPGLRVADTGLPAPTCLCPFNRDLACRVSLQWKSLEESGDIGPHGIRGRGLWLCFGDPIPVTRSPEHPFFCPGRSPRALRGLTIRLLRTEGPGQQTRVKPAPAFGGGDPGPPEPPLCVLRTHSDLNAKQHHRSAQAPPRAVCNGGGLLYLLHLTGSAGQSRAQVVGCSWSPWSPCSLGSGSRVPLLPLFPGLR